MNNAPNQQTGANNSFSQGASQTNPFTPDLKGEFTSNFGTNTNAVSQIFKEGGFVSSNRTKYLLIGGAVVILLAVLFYFYEPSSSDDATDATTATEPKDKEEDGAAKPATAEAQKAKPDAAAKTEAKPDAKTAAATD